MTSLMSEAERRRADPFCHVEQLEAALVQATNDAAVAEHEAAHVERLCEKARPVRPYANSLFAYFWTPRSLPRVPPVPVEPEVPAIRTERVRSADGLHGPAYRDDVESARARVESLQTELDATETRLARAQQRLARAERELARRQARAKLDERFSLKEYAQLLTFLALIIGAAVALFFATNGGRRW